MRSSFVKSSKLNAKDKVVADLTITQHELALNQSLPKLAADWIVLRMKNTHTAIAMSSKKRVLQVLKDQRVLRGKDAYQSGPI